MVNLDDPNLYREADPQAMGDRIAEMGKQIRDAGCCVSSFEHPGPEYSRARNVIVMGLGGSAIGGDLVRTLVEDQAPVPMFLINTSSSVKEMPPAVPEVLDPR